MGCFNFVIELDSLFMTSIFSLLSLNLRIVIGVESLFLSRLIILQSADMTHVQSPRVLSNLSVYCPVLSVLLVLVVWTLEALISHRSISMTLQTSCPGPGLLQSLHAVYSHQDSLYSLNIVSSEVMAGQPPQLAHMSWLCPGLHGKDCRQDIRRRTFRWIDITR